MAEFQTATSSTWSTLSTVKNFDVDYGINGKHVVPIKGDVFKPTAKSLFIESLVDQLCKLLEKNPQRRKKVYDSICAKLFEMKLVDETYQLEELASLRGYYQQAVCNLLRTPDPSCYKIPAYNLECSRYFNEYEEVGFIASGGFGKVYKARHRLDQVFYAVKKISIKFQNISALVMESNEVKTLAKLNHPNIVQYKAAWLEPLLNPTSAFTGSGLPHCNSGDSDEIVFQGSSCSIDQDISSSQCKEDETSMALCKYNSHNEISAVLHVSMQLCDETLREWLNKRNFLNESVDLPLCIKIMIEVTKGLEYIHSCNIVHHDIKPSNIFLSNNLKSIQVGDFGLSCSLKDHTNFGCPLNSKKFGTPLYCAPEQHRRHCNFKSDMYSLGLVFIEIVSIFATEMERVSVLTKSRSGQIPTWVPNKLVPVIKKLMSPEAEERPSSTELLKILYKLLMTSNDMKTLSTTKTELISFNDNNYVDAMSQTKVSGNCDIHKLLKIKDKEINELKLLLARKNDEIARLKNYL